jgi:N6-adenosine-specific RNA methylase IME4
MRAVTDAMADPPWDLAAIKALPVAQLAAPDGALICWATAPMLPGAIDTVRRGASNHLPARSAHSARATATGARRNSGLLATFGKPRQKVLNIWSLILTPVREHSRKPDQMRADIESLWDRPYCESLARERAQMQQLGQRA